MTGRKIQTNGLSLEKTLPYFLDHIKCGKTLAEKFLEKINLNQGSFFTILPYNALLDKLFDFNYGGIIPAVPCETKNYYIEGQAEPFHPRKIITMDQECSEFIANYLNKNSKNWAVVENYIVDSQSPYVDIKNVKMVPFNDEVYYFLNKNNSINEIYKTLRKSSQAWHFFAVLTELNEKIPNVLTTLVMDHICENAKIVIIGAYDGEAYIFWRALST